MVPNKRPTGHVSDQEIAAGIKPQPIVDVAARKLGVAGSAITTYGEYKAKINPRNLDATDRNDYGKLVLVTGVSPTPAGEGKTTTTIGLSDALNHIGVRSTACLREPSLGPCFGMKGGAHGGGFAQVTPMADINLHFNGDIHAVTSANNLLASLLDNHIYWGNQLKIDPERISWRRVLDLNDRVLRSVDLRIRRNLRRTDGFNITAASEIMAILCLAEDIEDLETRLSNIVIGFNESGDVVRCCELGIEGSLAVLLKDALDPNLVQSLEHNPVLIHGAPFANIAHGCNSVIATKTALALSDVVVTEAGFGADLGAEKFIDIKCRQAGLVPGVAVIVCTVRSLKFHGGVPLDDIHVPDATAVRQGTVNLLRHINNLQFFGLDTVVALNKFNGDTDEELQCIVESVSEAGSRCCVCTHWANGGPGATELAEQVIGRLEKQAPPINFCYESNESLSRKIKLVAKTIYRANEVEFAEGVLRDLKRFEASGFGNLPVCIAKTQYSFSADPAWYGAPDDYSLPVRGVSLSAGAGFVVAFCGDIMTMPGLPRRPSAIDVGFDESHEIVGLF